MTHAWLPVSPCTSGCVDDGAQIGRVGATARLAGMVCLFGSFPLANAATPRRAKPEVQRRYARAVLRCCGVTVRVLDERGAAPGGFAPAGQGVLVVAPHIGWSDVLVLAAVQPIGFVARADLIDWPLLGSLARLMRVIPIERANLRELPEVVSRIADRIAAGQPVAAFPEGTTWCGRASGRLRPALFQAAVDTGTAVQPVRLRYLGDDGRVATTASFLADETFAGSLMRLVRSRALVAEVVLLPPEQSGTDRRDLAARCERAVRGEVPLDFAAVHGVPDAADRDAVPRELAPAS